MVSKDVFTPSAGFSNSLCDEIKITVLYIMCVSIYISVHLHNYILKMFLHNWCPPVIYS